MTNPKKATNPFLTGIKISKDTHKKLKVLSAQLGCRVDFLSDYIINEYATKNDFGEISENPDFIKAKENVNQLNLLL
jgi:hypothetical protein